MGATTSQLTTIDNISPNDIIIAVVGRTGAGKSTFINTAAGQNILPITYDHQPVAPDVQYVECPDPEYNGRRKIIFADIPGFDLERQEKVIGQKLLAWLSSMSSKKLRITGVLYLYRVTEVTHWHSLYNRLVLGFCKGMIEGFPSRLALVSTMWRRLQDPFHAPQRGTELQEYWKTLPWGDTALQNVRFEDSFESAWKIVQMLPLNAQQLVNPYEKSVNLVAGISENLDQRKCLISLKGEGAQCIIDFVNTLLYTRGSLDNSDGLSILALLCALAKESQLFPHCFELKGVKCDFGRPIAGGGFADIYRANGGTRELCIKAVRLFRRQDNTQMLRAHVKELILWAHISHQNILPFYGVYLSELEPRRVCIVSPWMKNGDLPCYLADHPETPRIGLISDVLAGLAYLHKRGIVHGDLKGTNVLISDSGQALLADFGISHLAISTNLASTRLSTGTTRWTAPEILEFESSGDNLRLAAPTQASDVWSFSCVCYEVLAGKIPFYQYQNDLHLFMALRKKEVPKKPTPENQLGPIDDDVWTLMTDCWDYNPKLRPICEDIYQRLTNLRPGHCKETPVRSDPGHPGFWMEMKARSVFELDHANVYKILLGVKESSPCERARSLVFTVSGNELQRNRLVSLLGEKAQCIVDFLDMLLREDDVPDTLYGLNILSLLCGLARNSQCFPRCFQLEDVECDFSVPQAEGVLADVYRGKIGTREISVKAVRLFAKENTTRMLQAYAKDYIVWAHIRHQNILPFYGVFVSDTGPRRICIISPWMMNGDLPTYLARYPQTLRTPLIFDVLDGLSYLHERRIVHGNLKGATVLISDNGRALLIGPEESQFTADPIPGATPVSFGDARWAGPERLEVGKSDQMIRPTQASDVWSFAGVCYEALTGRIPFYQYEADLRLAVALSEKEIPLRPRPDSQIELNNDDIWALMNECWNYDPKERPTCEFIYQCLKESRPNHFRKRLAQRGADLPPLWEKIGTRSGSGLDYDRICDILLHVKESI